MIDRRQNLADAAELLPLGYAGKRSMLNQRVEQVSLANGNELVAR